jgi:hypothetical protein
LLVLEYITNPVLVILCGFPKILRSDVANAIHKEYIYKDISPIDFAKHKLLPFVKIRDRSLFIPGVGTEEKRETL